MNGRACDLVGSRLGWFLWGLPSALFLVGIVWDAARPWLWIPSLAVAGLACVANSARCGRLHCFVTGPLFAVAALATLLDAGDVLAIDWRWVLAAVVAGTMGGFGLEWWRGKYAGSKGCCS
jgi:hypothetical protein